MILEKTSVAISKHMVKLHHDLEQLEADPQTTIMGLIIKVGNDKAHYPGKLIKSIKFENGYLEICALRNDGYDLQDVVRYKDICAYSITTKKEEETI